MAEAFTWRAYVAEPAGDVTFAIKSSKFGDGYEQSAPDGLNNVRESWAVEFYGQAVADGLAAIEAFLRARGGAESFQWAPPGGSPGLFKCRSYKRTDLDGGWQRISATFEQSFQP